MPHVFAHVVAHQFMCHSACLGMICTQPWHCKTWGKAGACCQIDSFLSSHSPIAFGCHDALCCSDRNLFVSAAHADLDDLENAASMSRVGLQWLLACQQQCVRARYTVVMSHRKLRSCGFRHTPVCKALKTTQRQVVPTHIVTHGLAVGRMCVLNAAVPGPL